MKYFVPTKLSENMYETPEGFLVCVGVRIARTGTMDYHEKELEGAGIEGDQNGMIQIYRSEKEVFRPETIKSFEGKPFTITHPEDLVSPKNWSKLAHGIMQNVRRGKEDEREDLVTDLLVTSAEAIECIKKGMREVSCGYEADYEQTSPGKGIQTNIVGNHLALVEQGRAGQAYAITDHKGVKSMNAFEKIFGIFAKDPEALKAMKAFTADAKSKKTADEDVETDDEMPGWAGDMKKSLDALNAAVSNMAQPTAAAKNKDSGAAAGKGKEKEVVEDVDPLDAIMSKLEAMESRLAKLEGGTTDDEEVDTEDDGVGSDVVSDDEDGEEDEGTETDDEVGMDVVSGDTASRIEILAPGLDLDAKDKKAKVTALKTCFATKDGKRIIGALSGGKVPKWTDQKMVDHLFVSASEVMKAKRSRANAQTKFADAELIDGTPDSKVMTAEKMNELNAKHYANKH